MGRVEIIAVPYDSGRRGWRMGAGPEHLLKSGLLEELRADGHEVRVHAVETAMQGDAAAFDLARQVSQLVRAADGFALILGGNCISTLGGLSGVVQPAQLLWLDAHADFNTPETSPSGFLDGMALSVITGRCMQPETMQVEGFAPLPTERLLMMGIRSIDEGERAPLAGVRQVTPETLRTALDDAATRDLYLHIDLDVIDASVARINSYAEPGGLSEAELLDVIAAAQQHASLRAAALTAYDPSVDPRAEPIARRIIRALLTSPQS